MQCLDGVDDYQARLKLSYFLENGLGGSGCQEIEVFVSDSETVGTHFYLLFAFFAVEVFERRVDGSRRRRVDRRGVRIDFETQMSVAQCAQKFRESVQASYGPGRRLLRGLSVLRGNDGGGVEFFEPTDGLPQVPGQQPAWKGGAFVPGHSKMYGATRMAVHAYVVDNGRSRTVYLVGPYGMGDKGSTSRLLQSVAEGFGVSAAAV